MTLFHRARTVAHHLGLEVVRYEPRTDHQIRTAELIADLRITHVVDVGANVGQFAAEVRRAVGFRGRIDSFEPGALAFRQLQLTADSDPSWYVHRAALTDVPGELTLNVFAESDLSSLSTPSAEGRAAWPADWTAAPEVVQGRRLDEVELPDLGPVFLKIDTQGHDWNVILSARDMLERVDVLMTELSFVTLYESSIAAAEVVRRLDAMGYTLAALVPVNRVSGQQYLLEADGVFVRRAECRRP